MVEKTLQVLEDLQKKAQIGGDYSFELPASAFEVGDHTHRFLSEEEKAQATREQAEALSQAIAIIKAAKGCKDIFEDIVNNPEDWPTYQLESAKRILSLFSTDTPKEA